MYQNKIKKCKFIITKLARASVLLASVFCTNLTVAAPASGITQNVNIYNTKQAENDYIGSAYNSEYSVAPTNAFDVTPSANLMLPGGNYLFKIQVQASDDEDGENTQYFSHVSNKSIKSVIESLTNIEKINTDFEKLHWDKTNASAKMLLRGIVVRADLKYDKNTGTRTLTISYLGKVKIFVDHRGVGPAKSSGSANSGIVDEDVYKQLADWLKGNLGNTSVLTALSDAFVSQTAIDPVAGNPSSFMAQMVDSDFRINNNITLFGDTSGLDVWSISPQYYQDNSDTNVQEETTGSEKTEQDTQRGLIVPIQYSHYFGRSNRLTIDMPLSFHLTGEAATYAASLGVSDSIMLLQHTHWGWALTPQARFGAVGSVDMGSGTLAYSAGLGSRVMYSGSRYSFGLTNIADYMSTSKIKIGDIETPYDLHNIALKNGIDASVKFKSLYRVGAYYQRFDIVEGQTWYIPSSNTIGLEIAKSALYNDAMYDRWSLSAGYLFSGKKYSGFNFTLSVGV